jgi:hypothetical protein
MTTMERWNQLSNQIQADLRRITFWAKQIQALSGCSWGDALREALRISKEVR